MFGFCNNDFYQKPNKCLWNNIDIGHTSMHFKLVKIRNFYHFYRSLKRQFFDSRWNPSKYFEKLKLPIVTQEKGEALMLSLSCVLEL